MDILRAPRQSGKTTNLILMSAREQLRIIVPNARMAECVARRAKELRLKIPEPMSITRYLHTPGVADTQERVLVDELDMCLFALGMNVELATTTVHYGEEATHGQGEHAEGR